jgi:hypothetical protein
MSRIKLFSCFEHEMEQAPTKLRLKDVPLPSGMKGPKAALTTLYGFKDTLEEMSRIKNTSLKPVTTVEIECEFDRLPEGRVWLDGANAPPPRDPAKQRSTRITELRGTRFLYMDRLAKDLVDVARVEMDRIYRKAKVQDDNPFTTAGFITTRPDLLGQLMRTDMFRHVQVIVYRIEDPSLATRENRGSRQVATLFSAACVASITVRGFPNTKVILPKGLDAAAAADGIAA